ncbi:translocator protein [Selaginella moellendorffii]|uniref:translocator protein n=1 Tax=Selaginella moellendorffii TaxID=88036 RepID=UPI000D1C3F56|nr:translocator protein [Selaginella moellendorffii]|eukprot:XP_002970301.2 translocator protein [Selaginella moellendorffii]
MESTEGLSKRSLDKLSDPAPEEDKYHGKSPQRQQQRGGVRSLAIAVAAPFLLGAAIGFLFGPDKWYANLQKPSWNPPGWLFGTVWSAIYPLMGLASWLVWANGGWHKQSYPLTLYVVQLGLNLLWSAAFFGLHNPLLALADIVVLVVVVLACIAAFKPVNHVAANLMQVYLAWILFALALNASIWYMNMGVGGAGVDPDQAQVATGATNQE